MTRIKEFRDGLTQEIIDEKFPWINKADIEDAVLGTEYSSLVWYNATMQKTKALQTMLQHAQGSVGVR